MSGSEGLHDFTGNLKVMQYISPDLYFLCRKYLRFSENSFNVRGKGICGGGGGDGVGCGGGGGNELKTSSHRRPG